VARRATVAVGPCQGTSRIAQTINTNSGNSGGAIQRAMPIQKPKFFFVNVTGSETNGRLLVGFTTDRTSPCSSGFSLRGRGSEAYGRSDLSSCAGRSSIAGRSVHAELGSVDMLKSYATSRSRSRSRMHPSLRSSLSRSRMRALSSGGTSPASSINEAYSSSSSRTFLGSVRITEAPPRLVPALLTVEPDKCLCGKLALLGMRHDSAPDDRGPKTSSDEEAPEEGNGMSLSPPRAVLVRRATSTTDTARPTSAVTNAKRRPSGLNVAAGSTAKDSTETAAGHVSAESS
jgi:hypothetical protein